ncbi:hypothetical protein [Plantactinospora soyae]|uniref:Uncharacterized protein n=1 Tax=Plantactinospora soyae TaxID=1544732 RepID=A0A927M319_9ACTN|nr:hypothetical protein [Plantactinospora soyae]MBE1485900.1 hypothetical protein [Plantactinospora soyae]
MSDDLEATVSRLDQALAPIANAPVDLDEPNWVERMRQAPPAVVQAGVADQAETALATLLSRYGEGDESTRTAIRDLFARYRSFRSAVHPPDPADTPDRFRRWLLLLSARDQGADTRDELLTLTDLCREATGAGVEIGPILREVAEISGDVDHYGMGSMRSILLSCVPR